MTILLNRQTGQEEPADVISPIGQDDIDCYESEWLPVLQAKVEDLKRTDQYTPDGISAHNVEDAHWQWPAKAHDRAHQLEWGSYSIRCAGRTQGLMFVNMLRRCRLAAQLNEHMVYVDLLSTAPWNRPNLAQNPVYRGVGGILMTEAILQSKDEGFVGRIGLHALPRAAEFYRTQWGMVSLGPDPHYHGLHYFEMPSERAIELLGP